MGVIVIGLGTPQSAAENFGCNWEQLGAPAFSLGAPMTSLGAPRMTVEQSGKTTSSLGTLLVRLEIIATTYCSTIVNTHVLSLYSHLYVYIATDLHPVYLEWLQAAH
jgi:hypothetical protein